VRAATCFMSTPYSIVRRRRLGRITPRTSRDSHARRSQIRASRALEQSTVLHPPVTGRTRTTITTSRVLDSTCCDMRRVGSNNGSPTHFEFRREADYSLLERVRHRCPCQPSVRHIWWHLVRIHPAETHYLRERLCDRPVSQVPSKVPR
jgi:hypothetical protein